MDCTFKRVGGREGGGWETEGRLHHQIGLFGVAMSPRTTSHRPRKVWRAYETSH